MYRLNGNYDELLQTVWVFTSAYHCLLQLNLQKRSEFYQEGLCYFLLTY